MKPVIISQRVDVFPNRNEKRDALDVRLNEWVMEAGYIPFPVPNSIEKLDLINWIRRIAPIGLVLSGGNDVGKEQKRDALELNLLQLAEHEKMPVLGICRGMQIMAHKAKASLKTIDNHVNKRHDISVLGQYEKKFPSSVNSFHGMQIDYLPSEFEILARASEDNCIEAIRHKHLPWEGWMWHPERDFPYCNLQLQRLIDLMSN